jgi:hypothetical protein
MNKRRSHSDECIRQAADQLFNEAKHFSELTVARVLELAGGKFGKKTFHRVFPNKAFLHMKQAWLHQRIRAAMDEVFATAQTQRDISYQRAADLVGCAVNTVINQVGAEWQARCMESKNPISLRIQQAADQLFTEAKHLLISA